MNRKLAGEGKIWLEAMVKAPLPLESLGRNSSGAEKRQQIMPVNASENPIKDLRYN